jgi:sucrose-6-phosphatase
MKIIATDLDRTLLPNGKEREDYNSRKVFDKAIKKKNIKLVFVTGRNLDLVKKAMKKYFLPKPDFVISSVGTKIFERKKSFFLEDKKWLKEISSDWKGITINDMKIFLSDLSFLELQENKNFNEYKLSYYCAMNQLERAKKELKKVFSRKKIKVSVITSIDPKKKKGLIDIVPSKANKLNALKYLSKKQKIRKKNILYCGDSGNDLEIMLSGIKSVVVKNANPSFVKQLKKQSKKNIYFARGMEINNKKISGNYSSGVLEGAIWFNFL